MPPDTRAVLLLTLFTVATSPRAQYTVIPSSPPIENRWGALTHFDAVRGRFMVQGGITATPSGDTYLSSTAWFDGARWTRANLGGIQRAFGAMAPDPTGLGRAVLFGGRNASGTPLANTLVWDPHQNSFTVPSVTIAPQARHSHAMVYDSVRGRAILLGGESATGVLTDLWEWDGSAWRSMPVPPIGFASHGMAYDSGRGETVIFGGVKAGGALHVPLTFVYNGTTFVTNQAPSNPLPRKQHAMAFDPLRGRVVLFGGRGQSGDLADTWEWDGATWLNRSPVRSPEARYAHSMIWNAQRERIQIFGGRTDGLAGPFKDVWEYDGNTWTLLSDSVATHGTPITARHSHLAEFVPATGRMVVFGGMNGGNSTGDLWLHDGTSAQAHLLPGTPVPRSLSAHAHAGPLGPLGAGAYMFSGFRDGNAVADSTLHHFDGTRWTTVVVGTNRPTPRGGGAMVHDSARNRLVLFGGYDPATGTYADTWEFDGAIWSFKTLTTSPTFRSRHAMAFDPVSQRTLLFGGFSAQNTPLGDTWAWNGTQWTQLAPTNSPIPRFGHTMMFDPVRNRVILFGGAAGSSVHQDTWEWNGTNWALLNVKGTPPVTASLGSLVWDANRKRGFYFGGLGVLGSVSNEAYDWDGQTASWSRRELNPSIAPRQDHVATYMPQSRTTLFFGGWNSASRFGDTWEYDGGNWYPRVPIRAPAPRYGAAMALDPRTASPLVFGGVVTVGGQNASSGETFRYTGVDWIKVADVPADARYYPAVCEGPAGDLVLFGGWGTANLPIADLRVWTSSGWLSALVLGSPPVRAAHAMAYDRRRGVVVLFGGSGSGGVVLGDTWELSVSGGFQYQWTQRTPAASPPARLGHSMTFDESRGRVVLVGGHSSAGTSRTDIWEWDGTRWIERIPDTVPLPPATHGTLTYDSGRGRCVRFGGSDWATTNSEVSEIMATVDLIGPGHTSNWNPLLALSQPALGRTLRLWFSSPVGVATLGLGVGPSPRPAFTLGPPTFCSTATFWSQPLVWINPGAISSQGHAIQVPNALSLLGGVLTLQGVALQTNPCLLATDALNLRLVAP